MFFCCCPKSTRQLDQNLIESEPTKIIDKQLSEPSHQLNSNNFNSEGIKPKFTEDKKYSELSVNYKPALETFKQSKLKQSRHKIYSIQNLSEIVYCCYQQGMQSYLTFVLKKNNYIERTLSEYLIKKSATTFNLLIPSSKTLLQMYSKQFSINNTNLIFASVDFKKKQKINQDLIQVNLQTKMGDIVQIQGLSHIRINCFDRIFINIDKNMQIGQIKQFCFQITSSLSLEELFRVCYIFPNFLSPQEIGQIVFKRLRKYLLNQSIQKAIKFMNFEMQIVGSGSNQVIVVYLKSKEIQTSNFINIAIGILMLDVFDQFDCRAYNTLIRHLKEQKLLTYLQLKQSVDKVRKDPFLLIEKLNEQNFLNSQDLALLSRNYTNLKKIAICESDNECLFVIKGSLKQKITKALERHIEPFEMNDDNSPQKREQDEIKKQQMFKKQQYPEPHNLQNLPDDEIQEQALSLPSISLSEKSQEDI